MEPCQLEYIPERLRTDDRPAIGSFSIGEQLYFRCAPKDLDNPYNSISITELSHNRQGNVGNIISVANDVLFNIIPEANFELYEDRVICTIKIISLNESNQYVKEYKENENIALMQLLHEPAPCMYPHSVFRVTFNGEKVTYKNYKQTIQRANKLRNSLKTELASMIVREVLSQED